MLSIIQILFELSLLSIKLRKKVHLNDFLDQKANYQIELLPCQLFLQNLDCMRFAFLTKF